MPAPTPQPTPEPTSALTPIPTPAPTPAPTLAPIEFISNAVLPVPDNGMVEGCYNIRDINVAVNINHTWSSDLVISLIGPDNTTAILSERRCANTNDMIYTFDDEATNGCLPGDCSKSCSLCDEYNASVKPDDPLSIFDGKTLIGNWTL